MCVIILVIGPASGELHRLFSVGKVFQKMIVEELRAVVAIKPSQEKRQGCLDIFDLLYYNCFSFAPDSSLFCPAGGDIHTVEGKGKPVAYRVAKSPLRLDYVTQVLIWCISIGYTINKDLKGDIYDC